MMLGMVLAGLGEKDAAIAEGKRAMMLLPESRDALDGPKMTLALAQIYAWTGENDAALELLERSLITPAGVTVSSLKLNPIWDPLRSDARFQALVDISANAWRRVVDELQVTSGSPFVRRNRLGKMNVGRQFVSILTAAV